MATTLKSLARQLNLSHTTVAKILNDDPHFRTTEETRQRVRALASELGYRPAIAARHLLRGQTRHIGLLLHDLHDPFFAAMAHGVEKAVSAAGYSLVLGLSATHSNSDVSKPFDPTNWYIDGLIAGLYGFYPKGTFQDWNRRMPVLAIGYVHDEENEFVEVPDNDVPMVDFDQYQGSVAVGRHLVEQGCQRIAYLGWPESRRRDGLQEGVTAAGGNPIEEILVNNTLSLNILSGSRLTAVQEAVTQRLAASEPFPDGLFCFNDIVAGVAFGVLRRHGIRVPEDVCLVGFNNDPDSPYREVPLSSVAIPMDELCRVAVASVLSRLDGEQYSRRVILEPSLIVRESSRRIAARD